MDRFFEIATWTPEISKQDRENLFSSCRSRLRNQLRDAGIEDKNYNIEERERIPLYNGKPADNIEREFVINVQ